MNIKEKILWWIAYKIPKQIVYLCGIRIWANATTGEFSSENATDIKMDEAIRRWEK